MNRVKKLSDAANKTSYIGCDAATSKFSNPQSASNRCSVDTQLPSAAFIGRIQNMKPELLFI